MSAALELFTLAECEAVIERGLATFVDVGTALLKIRDERLYRAEFPTFDDYCRERWGFERTRAHRLIEAATVAEALPIGNRPANEGQARELAGLDADTAVDVMRHAEEIGDGKLTAAVIREARREVEHPEAQQLANDLAAHDAAFAQIARDLTPDDDPALTDEEECRALADPADLDDTPITEQEWRDETPMPPEDRIVDALERRQPGTKADLARVNLKAEYSRHVKAVPGLFVLDPEQVASVLDETDIGLLEGVSRQLERWAQKVLAARRRSTFAVVDGGKQ